MVAIAVEGLARRTHAGVRLGIVSEVAWLIGRGFLLGVGFVAAVSIGSIAWYNSKRPPGWESKERPDFVPKVDKDDLIADVSESKGK